MIIIGEIRDPKAAAEVEKILRSRSLNGKVVPIESGFVVLANPDDVSVKEIDQVYRVVTGGRIIHEIDPEWENIRRVKLGELSKIIIAASLMLFIYGYFGGEGLLEQYRPFLINSNTSGFFSDILAGEVWRLWTPMLLHFNFIHILFNLLWVKDLGSVLEASEGMGRILWLTLFYGLLTNVAQYLVVGPAFGGMSGVIFAYLGHMWMRSKFDSTFEFALPKRDIAFMIGWLVLCMTGIFGAIANVAHAVGLALGMISGVAFSISYEKKWGAELVKRMAFYLALALTFSALSIVVDWYHNGQTFFFKGLTGV